MENQIDALRDRIALCKSHLSRGVSEVLAIVYLNDISIAEAELAKLSATEARPESREASERGPADRH